LGRRCRMMEINPRFCQVAVWRFRQKSPHTLVLTDAIARSLYLAVYALARPRDGFAESLEALSRDDDLAFFILWRIFKDPIWALQSTLLALERLLLELEGLLIQRLGPMAGLPA